MERTESRKVSDRKWYQKNKKRLLVVAAKKYKKLSEEEKRDLVAYGRRWRKENPEDPAEVKARQLLRACNRVGIAVEYYNSLPKICSNPGCSSLNPGKNNWHKDHNHKTGKFRGLLCSPCNIALGLLKEDRNKIAGLITYLDKHSV